jgi:hypothetical protein
MRMGISFSSAAVPELRCRCWYSGGEDLALLAAAVRSRSARPVLAAPFSLARSSPLTPAGWMKRGFPSLDLGTSFFFCFVRCAQFRSVAVSFVLHIAGTLRHCFVLPRETVAICAFFYSVILLRNVSTITLLGKSINRFRYVYSLWDSLLRTSLHLYPAFCFLSHILHAV